MCIVMRCVGQNVVMVWMIVKSNNEEDPACIDYIYLKSSSTKVVILHLLSIIRNAINTGCILLR